MIDGTIRNPGCDRCKSLCKSASTVCLSGVGGESSPILFVGGAPGQREDEIGVPFVGRSGWLLKKALLPTAGLSEDEVGYTYAVRCRTPNGRTPSIKEIEACRPYLSAEIQKFRPKVVIVAGNAALASALSFFSKDSKEGKVSGIGRWAGKRLWHPEWGCWVLPMYDPNYVYQMRNQEGSEWYFERSVEVIKEAERLSRVAAPAFDPLVLEPVEDPERFLEVAAEMAEARTFAFDIETGNTGEHSWEAFTIGFSLSCDGRKGYYVSWDIFESRKGAAWDAFVDLMTNSSYLKLMHNGAYETRIFRFSKIPIRGQYHDTMIMAQLIDENFYKGLKDLTWLHTPHGGYERDLDVYKKEHKIKGDYSQIPFEIMWRYGAMDAVVTYQIWEKFLPRIEDAGTYPLFRKILMPVRRVMSDAEYAGILVDRERAEHLTELGAKSMGYLEGMIYEAAGTEFNIHSNVQLGDVLYRRMGLPILKTTDGGSPSCDREVVTSLAELGYPIGKLLANLSYVQTMIGNHVAQALSFSDPNGRVHPQYNLAGTVTGRTSCSAPSLQQVPQDRIVRGVYTVPEGHSLIEADLKSAELVYLAAVSGEQVFLNAFRDGADLHNATWRAVKSLPVDYLPTDKERNTAKRVNFGLVYGISPFGLSKQLKVTRDEAQEIVDLYFAGLHQVAEWIEEQGRIVRGQGYVESIFHRRRNLPMALSDIEYEVARAVRQATNAPIQSGASDYTYLGLVRTSNLLRRNKMRSRIIHTVHDCVLIEAPDKEAEDVNRLVVEGFEEPIEMLPVRMRVEVEVVRRWGEHKKESKLDDIFRETLGGDYVLAN